MKLQLGNTQSTFSWTFIGSVTHDSHQFSLWLQSILLFHCYMVVYLPFPTDRHCDKLLMYQKSREFNALFSSVLFSGWGQITDFYEIAKWIFLWFIHWMFIRITVAPPPSLVVSLVLHNVDRGILCWAQQMYATCFE